MAGSISATTAALIAAGVGAAGTATTLGLEEANKPSTAPTAAQQQQLASQQQLAQQKAAFLTAQAQNTSGGSSPPNTGLTANGTPVAQTAGTPAPADLQAMLKLLNPGGTPNVSVSGGTTGGSSPPTTSGLANFGI